MMKEEIFVTFPNEIGLSNENTLQVGVLNHEIHAKPITSLYSLKQAVFNWFKILDKFLIKTVKMELVLRKPGIYV